MLHVCAFFYYFLQQKGYTKTDNKISKKVYHFSIKKANSNFASNVYVCPYTTVFMIMCVWCMYLGMFPKLFLRVFQTTQHNWGMRYQYKIVIIKWVKMNTNQTILKVKKSQFTEVIQFEIKRFFINLQVFKTTCLLSFNFIICWHSTWHSCIYKRIECCKCSMIIEPMRWSE